MKKVDWDKCNGYFTLKASELGKKSISPPYPIVSIGMEVHSKYKGYNVSLTILEVIRDEFMVEDRFKAKIKCCEVFSLVDIKEGDIVSIDRSHICSYYLS
jgi:hypothetical protein